MKGYCEQCGELKDVFYCEERDKYTDNFTCNAYYCKDCIGYIKEETDCTVAIVE